MTSKRDPVLCISLTYQEWQAFKARCPQPVEWLRQQILQQIEGPVPGETKRNARTDAGDAGAAARS